MNTMEWGQISTASLIGMAFSLIISVGLPILLLVLIRKKTKAKISAFFIGCAIFVVFALVLEQMMHTIVLTSTGTLLTGNIFLYALYGGLAAALFEETGRLVAMKFLMKRELNKQNALMYGAGHGGIEAIILVGMTYVSNLLTSVMINSGAIQLSMSMLDENMQRTTFEQLRVLWELPSWQFYIAGVERTLAVVLHIGLSVMVYKAVKTGQKKYWFLAFALHFFVDFVTVIVGGLGVPVWAIEIILLAMLVPIVLCARKLYREDVKEQEEGSEAVTDNEARENN